MAAVQSFNSEFIHKISMIPTVSVTVTYAYQTYTTMKSKNEILQALLTGIEHRMKSAFYTLISYGEIVKDQVKYVDCLASKGLDKVENAAPIIKKHPTEIISETKRTFYATLSGVDEDIPRSVTGAFSRRMFNVGSRVFTGFLNSFIGKKAVSVTDGVVSTTDRIMDKVWPSKEGDMAEEELRDRSVSGKVYVIVAKTKRKIQRAASEAVGEENPDFSKPLTTSQLITAFHYAIASGYIKLKQTPTHERYLQKLVRIYAQVGFGTVLAVWGALSATGKFATNVTSKGIGIARHPIQTVKCFTNQDISGAGAEKPAETVDTTQRNGKTSHRGDSPSAQEKAGAN